MSGPALGSVACPIGVGGSKPWCWRGKVEQVTGGLTRTLQVARAMEGFRPGAGC